MVYNSDLAAQIGGTDVATAAMGVIDALQDRRPETQALGLAAAFLLLSDHLKVRPGDLFATAHNIINGINGPLPEFRAVRAYLKGEL